MKTIVSTLAAALIASASFAGAALAGGDYYEGVSKDKPAFSTQTAPATNFDRMSTGSIDNGYPVRQPTSRDNREFAVDHGDYYDGVNRPN